MESEVYRRPRDYAIWDVVGVCAMTRKELVEEVFSLPTTPVSATVELVGVPASVSSKEDKACADIYNNATIAAIDGMPIVRILRRKGFKCERCAAPDIMDLIFEESVKRGKTHYFYGGKDETVLRRMRDNIESRHPGISISGMYSPPFRPLTEEEDEKVCQGINRLSPDFLWVGIGAPKQEKWMQEHREKIKSTVMLGVGAGFDFTAGTLKKAPVWMEEAGIEWLFRLSKEPGRLWKRYLIGGMKFLKYDIQYRLGIDKL